MLKFSGLISIILLIIIAASCNSTTTSGGQSKQEKESFTPDFSNGPPVIIYKTKADYFNNVPVILSEDKTKVVSFPAPSDLYYKAKLATPFILEKGYLLDNRGINKNVAFLDYLYKDYVSFEKTPSVDTIMEHIIDKDPLLEFYNCGNRLLMKDEISECNHLIDQDLLGNCR